MSSTPELQNIDPVPTLLARLRAEVSADFVTSRPIRVARAPGRLDVMGGIADYTGSLVCEATLDRAAAVAIQPRADRQVQVFSFNLLDDHQPFTLQIPLDSLATHSTPSLHHEFAQPGRKFAAYLAGCLHALHHRQLINLSDPHHTGLNIALYSTVPLGAGVSSSAAIEVATMMTLRDHFNLAQHIDPMALAQMCQWVENHVVGAPCGIMDQVTSCIGQSDSLLRMRCQPHELLPPLHLPHNIRFVGINSAVKHSVGGPMYAKTRIAAFMGHKIILHKMHQMGRATHHELLADPMQGYLANLDPEDYKRFFRPYLPPQISGAAFLDTFGPTIDPITAVNPDDDYHVLQATDHHVLEAMRVRNFATFLEDAARLHPGTRDQGALLDKAGHLMYASHHAYTHDALLGAPECDLLVDLVRQNESAGLYGAKITGGGSGGTVAIMADRSARADAAIQLILDQYQSRTQKSPTLFAHSSPGAAHFGTAIIP